MTTTEHGATRKVTAALAGAGMPDRAERIAVLISEMPTAARAAFAVGVEVGAIAHSLLFREGSDERRSDVPLLALTSGAHRVDTGVRAALIGAEEAGRAAVEFVRSQTGQAIVRRRPGRPFCTDPHAGRSALGRVSGDLDGGCRPECGLSHHVRPVRRADRRHAGGSRRRSPVVPPVPGWTPR